MYSKVNVSSGVRTTTFWSGRCGFESLLFHILLRFHINLGFRRETFKPSYSWNFFDTKCFLETMRVPLLYQLFGFGPAQQNFFRQNLDAFPHSFPMHETFWYLIFFETKKGSPTNFSSAPSWDKSFSTENRHTPYHLSIFFFHSRNVSEHRREKGPLWSFLVLWDKKVSTKPWRPPPLVCLRFFKTRKFWSTVALWDQKNQQKIVISPSYA